MYIYCLLLVEKRVPMLFNKIYENRKPSIIPRKSSHSIYILYPSLPSTAMVTKQEETHITDFSCTVKLGQIQEFRKLLTFNGSLIF